MGKEYSFFLGCIMPNRYPAIESTSRFVLKELGFEIKEMDGASCCPAPGVFRSFNRFDWAVAGARNLAIGERNQTDILTACSGCFGTLFGVNHLLRHDPEMKKAVNAKLEKLGYQVTNEREVKHIAQVLGFDVGPRGIAEKIKRKANLKVAVHYGCHFLRPFNEKQIDDPESPTILEDYLEALGVECIDYENKYACCGAGGAVRAGDNESSMKMLGEKMAAVTNSEAEAILNICPFCHLQFDTGQKTLNERYGTNFNIPIVNISQVTAFCLGMDDVGLKYNVIAPDFKLEAAPLE
ncbi:MAG: CoB--CoM heterodisulfide reductase subunit B [Candidatus Thorarchaeota archaeon]|nr:MAG: CoB--CoM heterodisulfide reductase subunit B [Candidatus Thorarchaeota archaeon]RLI59585.1 MAG: CoB--CoM heterodisulfide reductase subunit B [Candidatus Thorarchaeota archaeon]